MKLDAWVQWVLLAGLSWGTYVPLIFYGGSELGGKSASRILAILCVGVAYFLIAVLFPLWLFVSGKEQWPDWSTTGLVFSGLAGVAGAIGALCVVFASKSAIDAAKAANLPPGTFRLYIAPRIFGMAPVINTLVSLVWHPKPGAPFHFGLEDLPGWKLWLGIVLVGAGAFLVLYSKEESESAKPAATTKPEIPKPA
jgi:drug/metabolite transporter (DMT)-like permease